MFFGVEEKDLNENNKDRMVMDKIAPIFIQLNIVGYYPDSKLNKEKTFISSMSDMQHAVYGAYANIFMTGDFRLYKKVEAIYEYLKIPTQYFLLKTDLW